MIQYPIERPILFVTNELLLEDKLCNVFAVMDDDTRPHGLQLCSIDETAVQLSDSITSFKSVGFNSWPVQWLPHVIICRLLPLVFLYLVPVMDI